MSVVEAKTESLVGADVVARYLGVTEITVYRWARRNVIPSVPITNKVRRFQFSKVVAAIRAKMQG